MKIVPVRWIDEVLDLALERPLTPTAAAKGIQEIIKAEAIQEGARDTAVPVAQPDVKH